MSACVLLCFHVSFSRIDAFCSCLTRLGISTKQLLLTALFKLSDRLGADSEDAIREIIDSFRNDINMELQQRACEYSSLLATDAQKRYEWRLLLDWETGLFRCVMSVLTV